MMKFQRIHRKDRQIWQPEIVAIEQTASYPLGNDFFKIEHGDDYFAFFDRLGEVDYYIGLEVNNANPANSTNPATSANRPQVTIVGTGILRQVPYQQGDPNQNAWYLCDLKVHPQHQGKQASMRILGYAIAQGIRRCDRGYLISMNPGDGRPNRLVNVLQRFPLIIPLKLAGTLNIYSTDANQMQQLQPLLQKHRGPIGYRSLQGIKDLRLQSNGEVLPLLHVQWGQGLEAAEPSPRSGFTHMFCAESRDDLALELGQMGISPAATASIVAHRMPDCDWRFVLTSDI